LGPFPGYKKNDKHMLRVMRNHRNAAYGATDGYETLAVTRFLWITPTVQTHA